MTPKKLQDPSAIFFGQAFTHVLRFGPNLRATYRGIRLLKRLLGKSK